MSSTSADHALATVADLLELAAHRLWAGAAVDRSPHAQSVGLGLYLAHCHVHTSLSGSHERDGLDVDADARSSRELISAAEVAWCELPRPERAAGWAALLEELRALHREVRALEE